MFVYVSRIQWSFHASRWDGIGQVMSSAWFPPDMTFRIEVNLEFNLGFIRPENLVSLRQNPLGAILHSKRAVMSFTEERLII